MQERRQTERLLNAVIMDQTEMIVRWRPDGTRTFVNDAYCRTFGRRYDELIGTSFLPLVAAEDREMILRKIQSITVDNPVVADVHRSLSPDGGIYWQEWTDR